MPLAFASVCELLDSCYRLTLSNKSHAEAVARWFAQNRRQIDAQTTNLPALLSTLLPDKRTDRVYCIQSASLERIVGNALFLGSSRIAELSRYKEPGAGIDLADAVAQVLTVTPNPLPQGDDPITVEEIDEVLHSIASQTRWSSPSVRVSQIDQSHRGRSGLELTYRRLSPLEARWLTRLVLKTYQPLVLNPHQVYQLCDPLLPCVLKIQDDFLTAIQTTQTLQSNLAPKSGRFPSRQQILETVRPILGIKVGRQPWVKGRSIKHCLDMGSGRMSVEEKMDGEYCQIHIDMTKGIHNCIQIFSKSGKDSTEDRQGLHNIITESLNLGKPGAKVCRSCILEGELVVYDDSLQRILPFHKIRQHVSRRGHYFNTEQDFIPGSYEHLMLVYYDIMLLDGHSLINTNQSKRFEVLSDIINCRIGWAELVPRQVVDFNHILGASALRRAFARVIADRKEGLVLKPDEPYFDFKSQRRKFSSCCIKLKKEYVGNFGDVGDFAAVGARYDPTTAQCYQIGDVKWTHYYIGCLENREEVKQHGAIPEFTVVNVVELNTTILKEVLSFANPQPCQTDKNDKIKINLAPGVGNGLPLSTVFTNPLVFDLRCFSFDKVGNTGFWSLRFPYVTKVHFDRDYTDTISLRQLQEMALDSTTEQALEDSQKNLEWIARLEAADPRGIAVDAVSQLTATTAPTPSPRASTQGTSRSWTPTSPTVTRAISRHSASQRMPPPAIVPTIRATSPACSPPPASGGSRSEERMLGKRTSPVTSPEATRKRQRPRLSSQTSHGNSRGFLTPPRRKPLMEIDQNPQPKATPSSSMLSSSLPSSQTLMQPSSIEDLIDPTTPNSENKRPSCSGPVDEDAGAATGKHTDGDSQLTPPALHRHSCKYAGDKCWLANAIVLASPDHPAIPELQMLLGDHGVNSPIMDRDEWVEMEDANNPSGSAKGVLLVESSAKLEGSTAVLESIEKRRRELPEGKRGWITIYDWRVLKYVTIMEDANVMEKYYDGWHDPWRRWYCGII